MFITVVKSNHIAGTLIGPTQTTDQVLRVPLKKGAIGSLLVRDLEISKQCQKPLVPMRMRNGVGTFPRVVLRGANAGMFRGSDWLQGFRNFTVDRFRFQSKGDEEEQEQEEEEEEEKKEEEVNEEVEEERD